LSVPAGSNRCQQLPVRHLNRRVVHRRGIRPSLHDDGGLLQPVPVEGATMAATNKSLARNNKSRTARNATKERWHRPLIEFRNRACAMTSTIKIRFTEPQIALVMRAHPNCNLGHLTELSFEFEQSGELIDCIGRIKDRGNIHHDYTGSGLARLYRMARRLMAARQTSAAILKLPNGKEPANAQA
jgi:hypothetical protein